MATREGTPWLVTFTVALSQGPMTWHYRLNAVGAWDAFALAYRRWQQTADLPYPEPEFTASVERDDAVVIDT